MNRFHRRQAIYALALVIVVFAAINASLAHALTLDEEAALRQLCKAGLNANGGIWSSHPINAAIATLAFGKNWPDDAQATAYKTCKARGYLN